jgi:integrase/recombinase XerD
MAKTSYTLDQVIELMLDSKTAEGKSAHTIVDYRNSFKKLREVIPGSTRFTEITLEQMIKYFGWLRGDYRSEPGGVAPRGKIKLSEKSILNMHTNLSSLWSFAVKNGYAIDHIIRKVERPKVNPPVVETFTRENLEAMLKASGETRSWKNSTTKGTRERRTALRDRAIILILLDTGLRASELCNIRYRDINMTTNAIKVIGKGNKERIVYFARGTQRALKEYLMPRLPEMSPDDLVFVVESRGYTRPLTRDVLLQLINKLGKRAGVEAYPHKFRHTFAINYLRNGGDIFTLQSLMGHSDLEMVRRYANVAQIDCEKTHRKASPVDNWRL